MQAETGTRIQSPRSHRWDGPLVRLLGWAHGGAYLPSEFVFDAA